MDNLPTIIKFCPVCGSLRLHYLFSVQAHRIVQCNDCGLLLLNPQPTDEALSKIYGANYFLLESDETERQHAAQLKQTTANYLLDLLVKYHGETFGGNLLEVGCGQGDFLVQATARGFTVTGIEYSKSACDTARLKLNGQGQIICGEIDRLADQTDCYDVCVLSDVLEHIRHPRIFLQHIHRLLKPQGILLVTVPNLNSWSAKFLKNRWMEFKVEHLFYFSELTLQGLLFHSYFGQMIVKPHVKSLSIDYIAEHFVRFPVKGLSPVVTRSRQLLPTSLRRRPFSIVASGMVILARREMRRERRKLSVIVPVFNESATVETLLQKLLDKQIDGLDVEIILVESNSTDGSRDIVLKYQNYQRITLVLEERPQGKGHAVRTGFQHVTGDFILIQDADLEYDLEDYEALLEPLVTGREAFVLGSRHGGRTWKIRHFEGNPVSTVMFNAGHWFFCGLVNLLYGLRLNDPFTMYKVFRRDCLYGLTFECNRFDFDYELLIKLVRKGYTPIEIPVNYNARSFQAGKKVSVTRDPWTWLRALIKYRLVRIDPMKKMDK